MPVKCLNWYTLSSHAVNQISAQNTHSLVFTANTELHEGVLQQGGLAHMTIS